MNNIYFFNGQDITMNVCIQIHALIKLIQDYNKTDFETAAGLFYYSKTYKILTQVENGLWVENAEFIFDRYIEEIENSK